MYVPKSIFFTKGAGIHKERLGSFEMALRDAGIAPYNLVRVSSIFPPHCIIVDLEDGLKKISPGQIIHCVMSENATNEPNRLIAASVGAAIPKDKNTYGYLSEHHSFGQNHDEAGLFAEYLAADMFATVRGAETDANSIYKKNATQIARGDENGLWTTVIACAVLLP